jgi:hypothetical protein
MRVVVADTSPLNYLVLIGQGEILLPSLGEYSFQKLGIVSVLKLRHYPEIVQNELRHSEASESVRRRIAAPPLMVEIVPEEHESNDPDLLRLDDAERAAILLAIRIAVRRQCPS